MVKETEVQKFQLWREDDFGNRFLIREYIDPAEALAQKQLLERSAHKQLYEVKPSLNPAPGGVELLYD